MADAPKPAAKVSTTIHESDLNALKGLHPKHPEIFEGKTALGPLLCVAALRADENTIKFLLEIGLDPNDTKRHDSENALAVAANKGRLDIVKLLRAHGAKMDVHEPTANPLVSTISSNAADVAQYLLDEGIDATVTYSGQNYQGMTAASLALEGGAIEVSRTIVLHIAGGDRDKAQALLLEAYETVKRNNPNARSYLPPPEL